MTDTMKSIAEIDRDRAATARNEIVQRSERIGSEALDRISAIKGDARLTPEARDADIAAIRDQVNAERAALGRDFNEQLVKRRDRVRRELCSPPAGAAGVEQVAIASSFRDALERSQHTDLLGGAHHPLADLAHQARLIADPLLERATLVTALERGDEIVLNDWVAEHPSDAPRVQEMVDLQHELTSVKAKLYTAMYFVPI